jgi:hypothetical protein
MVYASQSSFGIVATMIVFGDRPRIDHRPQRDGGGKPRQRMDADEYISQ